MQFCDCQLVVRSHRPIRPTEAISCIAKFSVGRVVGLHLPQVVQATQLSSFSEPQSCNILNMAKYAWYMILRRPILSRARDYATDTLVRFTRHTPVRFICRGHIKRTSPQISATAPNYHSSVVTKCGISNSR